MSSVEPGRSSLDRVIRTADLPRRFPREPDYEAQSRALAELAKTLAANPRQILQALVEAALDLCNAGSTGISILDSETGGDPTLFRWRALAGPWAEKYLGSTLPRAHSPCGVVLERNSVQLMTEPADYYEYVGTIDPPCREVLLVPFCVGSKPIGTIWAAMHEHGRAFDAEDARLLASLAEFTSAGYQAFQALERLEEAGRAQAAQMRELATADRLKDEFIATIAHELRNPLGPICTTAEVLKRAAENPTLVRQAADVLERQSSSMSRLIGDLLDVSRVRLGVLELKSERVELAAVLATALESSQLTIKGQSRRTEMRLARETVYVTGDVLRLTQVFGNLLNNAFKYSNTDGRIIISLDSAASEAVVSVTDNGIGIAADQLNSIFDMFAQAGQAGTPRSAGGLGIGLHLAKQLVEAHGGRLTATSAGIGQGSTFTAYLPLFEDRWA